MRFRHRFKPRLRTPKIILEPLEERIVLDASLDAGLHDDVSVVANHHDALPLLHDAASEVVPATVGAHGSDLANRPADLGQLNILVLSDDLPELSAVRQAALENVQVLTMDADKDSLQSVASQIQEMVDSSGKKVGHLAFLGHSTPGSLLVGTDKISNETISDYTQALNQLGQSMAENGQIQFYGCSAAAGSEGGQLMSSVASMTGANVFASVDATGSPKGNWTLEYASNAAVSMVSVIDADRLADVNMQLAGAVPSWNPGGTVDLGRHFSFEGTLAIGAQQEVADDAGETPNVTVTANANGGSGIYAIYLSEVGGATVTPDDEDQPTQWDITGTADTGVNAVLDTTLVQLNPDYTGDTTIQYTACDQDDVGCSVSYVHIQVNGEPLTVTVPLATIAVAGDTVITPYAGTTVITDEMNHPVQVTVQADHGTITAPAAPTDALPTTYTYDTVVPNAVTIQGDIPGVNTVLQGIQYQRYSNYTGDDQIIVSAQDFPNRRMSPIEPQRAFQIDFAATPISIT